MTSSAALSPAAPESTVDHPEAGSWAARRPATAVVPAVLGFAMGTLTSVAGAVFGSQAGGAWFVAVALFAVALPLWWLGGIQLLRGSRTGARLVGGLAIAELAFSVFKLVVFQESAGVPFSAISAVVLGCLAAPATRRWAR